jgi:aminoglycoside phosphotransferase (APT) family kinase protein
VNPAALEAVLGARVTRAVQVAGGASKEAWAVDLDDGRELLVRRAGGGVIHLDTLTLEQEFDVLVAARDAGAAAPEPVAYLGEVDGREAFAMERVHGETIGRRVVRSPPARLVEQMAEQLALIHAIPPERLPFLPRGDLVERLLQELDTVDEPHPAIEYGIAWCRGRLPHERERVVCHGDFRVGNLAVDERGLVAVLDWEFARVSDPLEDLAWPLVRAWRFGSDELHVGGVGRLEPYLARYAELTGRDVPRDELDVWEVLGNAKWAVGALTQARRHLRGEQRDVELAVLGRLAAEMEHELLHLVARIEGVELATEPTGSARPDRPSAGELAGAVREFLETEIAPTLDDHRLRFRTLVAMNALSIVERESPPPPAASEDEWELARRLRAGDVRAGDLVALSHNVAGKLAVASPRALPRYR